jgi:hypothetical protein
MTWSARTPAPLGTLRTARSPIEPGIWRGKAWNGRDGQAFALVESGVVDRATANSSPRTTTGHKQVDQTAETKPPAGSRSRILDQSLPANAGPLFKEPAARMTQLDAWASSRVGWTISATHAQINSLRIEHPIRTLTYPAIVTRRSTQDLCLSCDNCLLQ